MKLRILFLAIVFLSQFNLKAQSIYLDTNFVGRGHRTFPGMLGSAVSVAVNGQGEIIMAVQSNNLDTINIIHLKPNGNTDVPGDTIAKIVSRVNNKLTPRDLILQPDGKILIAGGFRRTTREDMMVIRLKPDGSYDETFGKNGIWIKDSTTINNMESYATHLALQSNGKIVVAGILINKTGGTNYKNIFVVGLDATGKEDPAYFVSSSQFQENIIGLGLHKDTIMVGGFYNGQSSTIFAVKLLPNRGLYTNGSWPNGRIEIATTTFLINGTNALAVKSNGEVFIGYSDNRGYFLERIFVNGTSNLKQVYAVNGADLTNIFLDQEEKIILTGHTTSSSVNYTAIKVNESGMFDSTFAVNGIFSFGYSGSSFRSFHSVLSKDKNIIMVGGSGVGPYLPSILKINVNPPIHIFGSEYVLPNSSEDYKVLVPNPSTYTYKWTLSGTSSFIFPNTDILRKTSLFFGGSATKVRLICTATPVGTNGGTVLRTFKDIFVNNTPTAAKELDSIQCSQSITNCSTGYIDYFKLNQIRNDSTGCSPNGYSDYTLSSIIDTLVVGGVYSATLRVDEPRIYVGIWIDYNNDGIFNTSDEFVAEQFSDNTFIQMNNIILKNETGYFGPKRMRVRCRTATSFNSVDACPTDGEGGETEDYMVVIVKQDDLAAPQVITPNEDGLNDYFVIRGIKPETETKLTVFDRLGALKFSSSNYENNWNGFDNNGSKLIPGTYYYVFTHDKKSLKGFLEIRY
jgi:gliding motility-associated-like protein/uncharacterized delta-60 repeat protein